MHDAATSRDESPGAAALLRHVRGRRVRANRLHPVLDATIDEHANSARAGAAPPIPAALRTTAVGSLRLAGATATAAARRRITWQHGTALICLGTTPA